MDKDISPITEKTTRFPGKLKTFIILFLILIISLCFFVVGFGMGGSWSVSKANVSTPLPGFKDTIDANKLWYLIQTFRVSNDLSAYIKDDTLCQLAKVRSIEVKTDWSHNGFFSKVDSYHYLKMGENLAQSKGFDEQQTLTAWLYSSEHAANLRDKFTNSCIVCTDGYCAQEFGLK